MTALKSQGSIPLDQRRYHITNILGQGGFGTVYRARLEGTDGFVKDVAIKILRDLDPPAEILARFRDEARILGLVRYPNIVNVDPPVRLHGRWAVVMEYVDGISCDELLQKGPLPSPIALEVTEIVALTLDHLWNAPDAEGRPLHLLHRDLKPSNIQLTPSGHVKVLDFGVAWGEFDSRETHTVLNVGGTPGYIAPERLDGPGSDSVASDVYSLGVMLEKLVMRNRRKTSADSSDVPRDVQKVLALATRMHDPDPRGRPTAAEVAQECRALRASMPMLDLREWAKTNVPPYPQRPSDAMCGQTLSETMSQAASVLRPPPPKPSGTPYLLAGMVSVSVTGIVLAVGFVVIALVLAVWASRRGDETVVDLPEDPLVTPEPVPIVVPVPVAPTDPGPPDPEPVVPRRPPRPRPPPAAPKVEQGTVTVMGEATSVVLACAGGTFRPGLVPAGPCDVKASFAGEPPRPRGRWWFRRTGRSR